MSREDYAKLFGITEILGFAYGGGKFTMADFWFAVPLHKSVSGFTYGLHIVKTIV